MVKPKTKDWTEEENRELLEFMEEGRKNGMQVRFLCEQFAKRDPQLTREQVRSHYYQLLNDPDKKKTYRQGPWSGEENDFLFETVQEKSKEMNKLEIFEYVGLKLNRNPRAVASHYYNIEKSRKQNESEELDKIIYGISKLNIKKIEQILDSLKKIQSFSDKEKEILNLQMKLESTQDEIKELKKQLSKAESTIDSYKTKFENIKKIHGTV